MKSKALLTIITTVSIVVLFSSCIKHQIEGNHQVKTEQRSIENFNRIETDGDFEVYYTQSSSMSLQVSAEENLLPYIYTKVEGNCLIIENREDRNIENHDPIKIYVSSPLLEQIDLNGSGSFDCDSLGMNSVWLNLDGSGKMNLNIWAKYLKTNISGSGDIDLSGFCDETEYKISGSGNIKSYGLIHDTCFTTISGSGSVYVSVNKLLDVKISGSGKVHYQGNPTVNTSITGSGSVTNH